MSVESYRTEVTAKLVKLDERQISIFKTLQRIEKHLDRLNGKTESHDKDITVIKTWGAITVVVLPIIINLIMRII